MLTLGSELISSPTVALAELVKNSYDADASHVLIKLDEMEGPDAPSIVVLDDGVGMGMDAVSRTWLEPATPNRRRSQRSLDGRRVLGEKGVGRFAAAKLGQLLTIVSRQQDSTNEVELFLDWQDFQDENAYLDEIQVLTESRPATFFSPEGEGPQLWNKSLRRVAHSQNVEQNTVAPKSERGTLVKITGLHSSWSAENVKEAQRSLSRLISPFADQTWRGTASDFQIILDLPDRIAEFSGPVGPPAELGSPHYRLEAKVNNSGHAEIEIWLRGKEDSTKFSTQLPSNGNSCGPFEFYLKVWERDRQSLTESGGGVASYREIREALDATSGISVYRDGFRVLPYGEPGNDWLALDRRRINSPTRRLSNSQVVGQLLIDRDNNPELIDQTNREGLVSGPFLSDLQSKVRQLITELEARRYLLRPAKKSKEPISRLFERRELSELREAVAARSDDSLLRLVEDAEEKIEARDTEIREVLARYQRLATLGQLIDQVVHEVGQPVSACRKAALAGIEIIEDWFNPQPGNTRRDHDETFEGAREKFEKIRQQAATINDVLNRFTPFGGRRRGRPHTIVLERAIREAASILDGEIKKAKVKISLPEGETSVTVDNTEIQEVVINLLSNSIYWVSRLPAGAPRRIALTLHRSTGSELSLIVSDSGPGVPSEIRDQIFDPYFSNRDGGMGLGLTIAGEIISDYYGGELVLEPAGPLGGATFRATLRRRVGE